jgi:hypothetical protein
MRHIGGANMRRFPSTQLLAIAALAIVPTFAMAQQPMPPRLASPASGLAPEGH